MNRDQTLDILKGIGIILMVVAHSGAPDWLHDYIYTFHMPLFFIASGWFFSERNLGDCRGFAFRKMKAVYWPYLKWCIIFLLLHNVFYSVGILNGFYGANGVVNNLYNIKEMASHAVDFTFRMTGYEGLLGTYWFLRSLLWGSFLLCFCSALLHRVIKLRRQYSILATTALFGVLGGVLSGFNIHIPYWPRGGYREMMAVFFLGMGYFIRKDEWWKSKWWQIAFLIIIPLSLLIEPTKLSTNPTLVMWLLIPLTGMAGYALVYKLSNVLAQRKWKCSMMLSYIGRQTFYIMTFHFLMFKPASLLKAYIYGMDWRVIGYHPVIPPDGDNWYWIVYSISSIILSLALTKVIQCIPFPKLTVNNKIK